MMPSYIRVSPHVILKDDGGADFIHKRLVLTRLTTQTAVYHGPMGEHRGKALVVIFYRNGRHGLAPSVDKLLHTREILARFTVRLQWFADDNAFNRLTRNIITEVLIQP